MTTLVLLLTLLGLPPGELARVTAAPGAVVIERSPEGAVSVTIPTSHGHVVVVVDGTTGILVDDLSVEAFTDGVSRALSTTFDPAAIRAHAEGFGRERFGDEIEALVRGPVEAATR